MAPQPRMDKFQTLCLKSRVKICDGVNEIQMYRTLVNCCNRLERI